MISAPGSPNIRIAMYMVTLPPGTTMTRSGDTSTLNRLFRSAAIASRSCRMPVAGV